MSAVELITVEQARSLVLDKTVPSIPQSASLDDALDHVLAQDIASDVDSPPHDKSLVDGYAVQAADASSAAGLRVIEEVTAGEVPLETVVAGTTIRIMTGAPLPAGADAVVMVEETEVVTDPPGAVVRIQAPRVSAGQNIMRRSASVAAGEVVLSPGHRLRPIEIGLLAEVGAAQVEVFPRPTVAVLSTGNELVPFNQQPGPGQIRNSNGAMLDALVKRAFGVPVNLGIGVDEQAALRTLIQRGLQQDVLVLSGGVSAGVLDLVPAALDELGVQRVFHKVNLKPGKPLWFGVLPGGPRDRLVFGLPGNPVSSLVCFELFVRPALRRLAGQAAGQLAGRMATLASPFQHRGARPTFCPGISQKNLDALNASPLPWKGSADLRTLVNANCLILFPAGDRNYELGEAVEVFAI